MDYEYHWIYCPDCDRTLVFESGVEGEGEDVELIVCPDCGRELAEIRTDEGCYCIGIACGHMFPDQGCRG